MIIAFEGADGSGKSTQMQMLSVNIAEKFETPVRRWHFPDLDKTSHVPIKLLLQSTERSKYESYALHSAIYFQRLKACREIEVFSEAGGIALLDRWAMSGVVYGVLDGLTLEHAYEMQNSLIRPDWQILLEVKTDRSSNVDNYEKSDLIAKADKHFYDEWTTNAERSLWDSRWSVFSDGPPDAVAREIFEEFLGEV